MTAYLKKKFNFAVHEKMGKFHQENFQMFRKGYVLCSCEKFLIDNFEVK